MTVDEAVEWANRYDRTTTGGIACQVLAAEVFRLRELLNSKEDALAAALLVIEHYPV